MMNPELTPFLDRWAAEWAPLALGAPPSLRRAHFEVVAKKMRLPTPDDVDTTAEHWIDSPSGPVRVRVFRHISGGVQPCLVYMHGGAWMQGSPETHWDITARIASWNRQTVISVDYAKSPEHPFPAAFNQVAAVMRWTYANAAGLGLDPARIAIGGDSAGGNLAAAVALELRGEMPILAQLLIYPPSDFDLTRPSMIENAEAPILQTKGMPVVNAMYCPETRLLTSDPRLAPLVADSHAGLPPTLIALAEYDPLRDSGLAYAKALQAAGVPVVLDHGTGLIHGYLRAMEYCADSVAKLRMMAAWLNDQNAGTA
ncbi:alpha/beta hydrolase [Actibacterium sp.]|uniref:alpha/beta hydrolase n=1 Tax=Actibacterium sp. TaxID=1872125 RepID=UPI0035647DD5